MRKREKFSSIFEAASKMHSQEKEKDSPKEPQTVESYFDVNVPLDERFKECIAKSKEIQDTLEKAFDKAGLNPHKLREYLEDPSHFSSKEWSEIMLSHKEFERTIAKPTQAQKEEKQENEPIHKKKKKDPLLKHRWIPMQ